MPRFLKLTRVVEIGNPPVTAPLYVRPGAIDSLVEPTEVKWEVRCTVKLGGVSYPVTETAEEILHALEMLQNKDFE